MCIRDSAWTVVTALLGFLVASLLMELVDAVFGLGTISALCVLLLCELMVRARDRIRQHPLPLQWHCLDLFRLGLIYGVALEAFKVGS